MCEGVDVTLMLGTRQGEGSPVESLEMVGTTASAYNNQSLLLFRLVSSPPRSPTIGVYVLSEGPVGQSHLELTSRLKQRKRNQEPKDALLLPHASSSGPQDTLAVP